MMNVRKYTSDDFQTIRDWYARHDQLGFERGFIPEYSSFIVSNRGEDVAALSLVMTGMQIAYLENFVANPDFNSEERKPMINKLVQTVEDYAAGYGYKRLICLAPNEKLVSRYTELGYKVSLTGVTTLVKELKVEDI